MPEHSNEHRPFPKTERNFAGASLLPGAGREYCCAYRFFESGRYHLRSSIIRNAAAARECMMDAALGAYAGEFRIRLCVGGEIRLIHARLGDVLEWNVSEAVLPKQFEASCWQADLDRMMEIEAARFELLHILTQVRERGHAPGSVLRSFGQQFERILESSEREINR